MPTRRGQGQGGPPAGPTQTGQRYGRSSAGPTTREQGEGQPPSRPTPREHGQGRPPASPTPKGQGQGRSHDGSTPRTQRQTLLGKRKNVLYFKNLYCGSSQTSGSSGASQSPGSSQTRLGAAVSQSPGASQTTLDGAVSQSPGSPQTTLGAAVCQSPESSQTPQEALASQTQRDVQEATNFWLHHVRDCYPNRHQQTYFLPPLHFNRVSYATETVAGQTALVPQVASDQPTQAPTITAQESLQPSRIPSVASLVWRPVDQDVHPGPLQLVSDSDTREDTALKLVLDNLKELSERNHEVMMVISQLQFRKYLDNTANPISAAAVHWLSKTDTLEKKYQRGDFDVLIINRRYGLIVGELKAVGFDTSKTQDMTKAIMKRVKKSVDQMNKARAVLQHLVSDLVPRTRVITTLMLPYVSCEQLKKALSTDPPVEKEFCTCVDAQSSEEAVEACLCSDNLDTWWQRAVTDRGVDGKMTYTLYETLLARFCGPATSVEVPCVTTPRRCKEIRTLSEAIALTGLRLAILTLNPDQVDLVNDHQLQKVFLWGPPGTGKTVVLTIKGMQWRQKGKVVHLMSSHPDSQAATLLIEHQLRHCLPADSPSGIHRLSFDFEKNAEDVDKAVDQLAAAASDGELYLIADEAHHSRNVDLHSNTRGRFKEFCTKLAALVPTLHLWAAAVKRDVTLSGCMEERRLTKLLRCPPTVGKLVKQSSSIDDNHVPRYTDSSIPAPTEGPEVREFQHRGQPGHITPLPEDCERCADKVVSLIEELRINQTSQGLEYRDVIILCQNPSSSLPVVEKLEALQVPVQVVTQGSNEVTNLALARDDEITVTDAFAVTGLERRVVIVVGLGSSYGYDARLQAMSRSTSSLAYFD